MRPRDQQPRRDGTVASSPQVERQLCRQYSVNTIRSETRSPTNVIVVVTTGRRGDVQRRLPFPVHKQNWQKYHFVRLKKRLNLGRHLYTDLYTLISVTSQSTYGTKASSTPSYCVTQRCVCAAVPVTLQRRRRRRRI